MRWRSRGRESEHQAQGTLNNARSTAYNTRGCADRGSSGTAHGRRDFAKVPAALVGNRVGKIGVVKKVEEVCLETQMESLGTEREKLRRGKIPIL